MFESRENTTVSAAVSTPKQCVSEATDEKSMRDKSTSRTQTVNSPCLWLRTSLYLLLLVKRKPTWLCLEELKLEAKQQQKKEKRRRKKVLLTHADENVRSFCTFSEQVTSLVHFPLSTDAQLLSVLETTRTANRNHPHYTQITT